jgi:hypothetical protein
VGILAPLLAKLRPPHKRDALALAGQGAAFRLIDPPGESSPFNSTLNDALAVTSMKWNFESCAPAKDCLHYRARRR